MGDELEARLIPESAGAMPCQAVPAPTPVQRLDLTGHRVWVASDIHGCFDQLQSALDGAGFDPGHGDVLVLAGDLVNRGPDSLAAVDWLETGWVHACRGNHEQIVLDGHFGHCGGTAFHGEARAMLQEYGGDWFYRALARDPGRVRRLLQALSSLPWALEITLGSSTIAVVHANVPEGLSWPVFRDHLMRADHFAVGQAISGRSRAFEVLSGRAVAPVEGVDWVIHGHTPMDAITTAGNVVYVDTGSVFDGEAFDLLALNPLASREAQERMA